MAPSYRQTVAGPLPGVTNYPQLFQNPPPAPPADPYMMPTPIPESELPSSTEQLPPHYEMMETPSAGQPSLSAPPAGSPLPARLQLPKPPLNKIQCKAKPRPNSRCPRPCRWGPIPLKTTIPARPIRG